jgi:hypothetical protein
MKFRLISKNAIVRIRITYKEPKDKWYWKKKFAFYEYFENWPIRGRKCKKNCQNSTLFELSRFSTQLQSNNTKHYSTSIMQIFVKLQGGRTRSLCFGSEAIPVSRLKQHIEDFEGIPCHEQRLACSQRELLDDAVLSGDEMFFVSLSLRVVGGKGGFGSLLRGAPSKIGQKKTDNFDACRDILI